MQDVVVKHEFVCKECSNKKVYDWKRPRTKMGTAPRPWKVLGGLLKMSREAAGVSIRKATAEMGFTDPGTLRTWERGTSHPDLSRLHRLVELYEIDPDRFEAAVLIDRLRAGHKAS